MERKFTISQVASMLGLGIDAVRFYEKKGLVHPQINPANNYRMYSLYQIMELLDISYYRSLGMSISQISSIYQDSNEEQLVVLLEEKRLETQKKIRYEQQILKRIEHVESLVKRVKEQAEEIDITFFPQSNILFEQREDDLAEYIEQVSGMDYDRYVFCQLAREYTIVDREGKKQPSESPIRTILLIDCQTTKELGGETESGKLIHGVKALHSVVRFYKANLQSGEVEKMMNYAKAHNIKLKDELLVIEIPLISYTDFDHYYAELFIPIAEE